MNIEELIAAAEALGLNDLTLRALRAEKRRALHSQVLDALRDGQTATNVAAAFSLSCSTVRHIAIKHGVAVTKAKRGPPSQWQAGERELAMVEAFKAGQTLEQISAQHGVTRERVRQLIKKTAGEVFGGASLRAERRKADLAQAKFEQMLEKKERLDAVRAAYVYGEHLGQLAGKFGFGSPQQLNNWLRQNGVPARSGKGRQKAPT